MEINGLLGSVDRVVNDSDFIPAAGKFNYSGGIIFNGELVFNVPVGNFSAGARHTGRFEFTANIEDSDDTTDPPT